MANFVTTNNRHVLARSVCWQCVQSENGVLPLESKTTCMTWHHKADHKEYSNEHSTNMQELPKHSKVLTIDVRELTFAKLGILCVTPPQSELRG